MMMKAQKWPLGNWLVWQIIRSGLTKRFHAVHVHLQEPLDESIHQYPTLYYVNHSNWWDGFVCMTLVQYVFHQDSYLMMEEKNLRRYRFFTWAGVYGVDRDDARAALASLEYGASLLKGHPGRGMYIFPQGTMVPNERRPLIFFGGLARLALQAAPVRLVPIAMRYEFLQEQRPEIFMDIGPARLITPAERLRPKHLTQELQTTLTDLVDALTRTIIAEDTAHFTTVLRGQQGVDRVFDRATSQQRRRSRRLSLETEQ